MKKPDTGLLVILAVTMIAANIAQSAARLHKRVPVHPASIEEAALRRDAGDAGVMEAFRNINLLARADVGDTLTFVRRGKRETLRIEAIKQDPRKDYLEFVSRRPDGSVQTDRSDRLARVSRLQIRREQ